MQLSKRDQEALNLCAQGQPLTGFTTHERHTVCRRLRAAGLLHPLKWALAGDRP